MAKVNLNTIKNWFKTGLKPTQGQFWDTWDSFWHKEEKIPIESIENLDSLLGEKADQSVLDSHIKDTSAHGLDQKVDKEEGKGLSAEDFTTAEKEKLAGLENIDRQELIDLMASNLTYTNPNPSNFSVGGVPKSTTFDSVTIKEMFDRIFYGTVDLSTEIEFEVTVTPETVNTDIPLISMYNTAGAGQFLVESSDGFSELNYIPAIKQKNIMGLDGNPTTVDDGELITHRWTDPGVYMVKISTSAEVLGTKFTSIKNQARDRIQYDVDLNPHITKLIKYKSLTIENLNYTFAGLSNCTPTPDFTLETPEVKSAYASFFRFGDSAWKANALASLSSWEFNKDLLAQCSKLTAINGTFYLCNLKRIPVGFFDALNNVEYAFDTFKLSSLGLYPYVDYSSNEYINENLDGISFIPMNLLHNMPKLKVIEGMFNAIASTGRQTFGTTGENTTGTLGYGNWCNLGIFIKADFFFNGKDAGNTQGTIENIDYVFGKINQCAIQPNVLQHIAHSVKQMEGAFYAIHWPLRQTISQGLTLNWSNEARKAEWLANTTLNVKAVLGTGTLTYPSCIKINGAFGKNVYNQGFNGTHDIWGWEYPNSDNKFGLTEVDVEEILLQFPLAMANQAPVIQSPTATNAINGASGALNNMTMNSYASKAEYQAVSDPDVWDVVGKETMWY